MLFWEYINILRYTYRVFCEHINILCYTYRVICNILVHYFTPLAYSVFFTVGVSSIIVGLWGFMPPIMELKYRWVIEQTCA